MIIGIIVILAIALFMAVIILRSSYSKEVTMSEVEKELQQDIEQGVITSYTIVEQDFIVYKLRDGQIIDLSRYDIE